MAFWAGVLSVVILSWWEQPMCSRTLLWLQNKELVVLIAGTSWTLHWARATPQTTSHHHHLIFLSEEADM